MTATIIQLRPKLAKHVPRRRRRKPYARRRYEFYIAFGRRLRYARARLNITEQEAAASFGVSVRTYRKYEAGKRPRDGSFGYLDFAYTFDVEPAWLLGIKGFEPPRFRLRVV